MTHTHTDFDPTTQANITAWLEGDYDEATKAEIRELISKEPQKAVDAFYTHLSFGTGGLRGIMGVGTNRMNIYTVGAATQGLANYIKTQPAKEKEHSVFIGHDSRFHSREFAEEAAKVLAANGIRAYLADELRPTPYVSFGCRTKGCTAAIMITASHNPPEYNGYKVYWSDGGQVVPPHDRAIIDEVKKITDNARVMVAEDLDHPLITLVNGEIDTAYLESIAKRQLYPEVNHDQGCDLKIVYTSLHGTGITLMPQALSSWGFKHLILVEKQVIPDGSFPTAHIPNPEQREALKLGIQTMEANSADILIATDPDADRVGVAVRHRDKTELLTGNQVAALCLAHICHAGNIPESSAVVKSIGTTELFRAIATKFAVECFDVLPGFKYIAEKIHQWEQIPDGYHFLFGAEESYGYLIGTHSRDKDAIVSGALICEMALQAKLEGKTLIDKLHELYQEHGIFFEKLLSIKFPETKIGKEAMEKGMAKLRENPPKTLAGVSVETIDDILLPNRLNLPTSNVLLFWLKDGTKVMVRPSGTEPKVKLYCGVMQKEFDDLKEGLFSCEKRADALLSEVEALLK